MSTQPKSLSAVRARLTLEYPLSLGTFDKYEEAQKAVDTLSDKEFPVQNCLIVGTELKQLERITGRLTWGRVLLGGALSGVWLGLFVGLIFSLFDTGNSVITLVLSTVLFGAIFGMVWGAITYAATGGHRDFSSVSQIVPSKYEVLVEHKFAQQAREILTGAGVAASPTTSFSPAAPPPSMQKPPADPPSAGGTPGF
ncbi:MAG: general stress protein [Lapillicoccus sp.]